MHVGVETGLQTERPGQVKLGYSLGRAHRARDRVARLSIWVTGDWAKQGRMGRAVGKEKKAWLGQLQRKIKFQPMAI
jgi:hypothetical protein